MFKNLLLLIFVNVFISIKIEKKNTEQQIPKYLQNLVTDTPILTEIYIFCPIYNFSKKLFFPNLSETFNIFNFFNILV